MEPSKSTGVAKQLGRPCLLVHQPAFDGQGDCVEEAVEVAVRVV